MARIPRSFADRSEVERFLFLQDTWCEHCDAADLGLVDPQEYEEDGRIFIEGRCRKCGQRVVSQIEEGGSA